MIRGLGLVGQLALRLARAAGCEGAGIDVVPSDDGTITAGPLQIRVIGTGVVVNLRRCHVASGFGRLHEAVVIEAAVTGQLPIELRTILTVASGERWSKSHGRHSSPLYHRLP